MQFDTVDIDLRSNLFLGSHADKPRLVGREGCKGGALDSTLHAAAADEAVNRTIVSDDRLGARLRGCRVGGAYHRDGAEIPPRLPHPVHEFDHMERMSAHRTLTRSG